MVCNNVVTREQILVSLQSYRQSVEKENKNEKKGCKVTSSGDRYHAIMSCLFGNDFSPPNTFKSLQATRQLHLFQHQTTNNEYFALFPLPSSSLTLSQDVPCFVQIIDHTAQRPSLTATPQLFFIYNSPNHLAIIHPFISHKYGRS